MKNTHKGGMSLAHAMRFESKQSPRILKASTSDKSPPGTMIIDSRVFEHVVRYLDCFMEIESTDKLEPELADNSAKRI